MQPVGKQPVPIFTDRANSRIRRFNLSEKHSDFIEGISLPYYFHRYANRDMLVRDLGARGTL